MSGVCRKVPRDVEVADLEVKAREIYESGKFVQHVIDTVHKNWYGDDNVIRALLLQSANNRVVNTHVGINIHLAADAQEGKSELVRKVGRCLPFTDFCESTFSNYALFEPTLIHDNMVIFSDDTSFSEETVYILKSVITAYEEGTSRKTMENKVWVEKRTAKHLQLILTSVESVATGDSQNQMDSRFLTIQLIRNAESRLQVFKSMQVDQIDTTVDEVIAQCVWDLVERVPVIHHKVYTPEEVPSINPRDFGRFLAMVRAHARLCNREVTNDDDVAAVIGIMKQSRVSINAITAGLTPNENIVWSAITSMPQTVLDLMKATKLHRTTITRALVGMDGSIGNPKGGLASKVPLGIRKEEVVNGEWVLFRA